MADHDETQSAYGTKDESSPLDPEGLKEWARQIDQAFAKSGRTADAVVRDIEALHQGLHQNGPAESGSGIEGDGADGHAQRDPAGDELERQIRDTAEKLAAAFGYKPEDVENQIKQTLISNQLLAELTGAELKAAVVFDGKKAVTFVKFE